MTRARWAFVTVVAALAVGSCGGDDDADDTSAATATTGGAAVDPLGESSTFAACADAYVAALEGFDLSGIDAADGLDAAELQAADDRFVALETDHPVLAEEHPCSVVVEGATDEELAAFTARLDPVVLQILATPAEQVFQPVGEEIGG